MSSPLNDERPGEPAILPLADAPLPRKEFAGSAPPSPGELDQHTRVGEPERSAAEPADAGSDPLNTLKLKPLIIDALSKVFDPEIPVNIYELGLIYDIMVDATAAVTIRMTLTSPGCPAAQTIPVDVERHVREIPGVRDVRVDVVWDPTWGRERMSEAAKLALGMY